MAVRIAFPPSPSLISHNFLLKQVKEGCSGERSEKAARSPGPASDHSFRNVLQFREVRQDDAQGGKQEKDVQCAACRNWDGLLAQPTGVLPYIQ